MATVMRVLLVEDDVDLAELLAGQLSRLGFLVRLAHRCEDARAVSGGAIDVVLADGELPDGSAADIARHFASLPKVALTGNPRTSATLVAEHGFHAALVKPVPAKVLAQALRAAVAAHSAPACAPATDPASREPGCLWSAAGTCLASNIGTLERAGDFPWASSRFSSSASSLD